MGQLWHLPLMPRPHRRPPLPVRNASAPEQPILDLGQGVRILIEGDDPAAVEAAASELKARLGSRFAVTDRRLVHKGATLRITAGLRIDPLDVLDVETAPVAES